jgi:hypothetical protein
MTKEPITKIETIEEICEGRNFAIKNYDILNLIAA